MSNATRRCFSRLLSREIPSYSIEKRYLRKDGTPIHLRVTSSPVDMDGMHRLLIVQDLRTHDAAVRAQREGEAR
jgi:PAS domain S-box-containing protein